MMVKRVGAIVAAAMLPAVVLPMAAAPAEAASAVRISPLQYDSPGSDSGSNASLNAEWVRVHNYSTTKKVLTGWTLRDASGHVYRFGTYTLRPGSTVRIHTGKGSNTAAERYWGQGWYVWNNDHDKATLKNKAGTVVSVRSW